MSLQDLKPEFNVGKNGLNANLIKDIKERLKKKKYLKIRFLSSAVKGKNKEELFAKLKEATRARLIKKVGFTVILRYEKH